MSADNGFILRRNKDNKFVLQGYWASGDRYPEIDGPAVIPGGTLEEALDAYETIQNDPAIPVEYGLTVLIKEVTDA